MEFYFLRHGLVDYGPNNTLDKTPDVSLNATGRLQAETVRPVIERLPIRTICVSPLMRARQTQKIVSQNLNLPVVVVEELRECGDRVWQEMSQLGKELSKSDVDKAVHDFMSRAVQGIYKSLEFPGPVLIVAHGGIHWAFCHELEVKNQKSAGLHPKSVTHCLPIHFSRPREDQWLAAEYNSV
jgi:probable phosphoglycerate mutase